MAVGYEEIIRQRLEALSFDGVAWKKGKKWQGPMRKRRPVTRIAYAIRPTLHFLLLVQNGTNIESSVLGMVFKGEARAILRMKVRKFFK